jgi:hypothetical protein
MKFKVEITKRVTYIKIYEIDAANILDAEIIAKNSANNDKSMDKEYTEFIVSYSDEIK